MVGIVSLWNLASISKLTVISHLFESFPEILRVKSSQKTVSTKLILGKGCSSLLEDISTSGKWVRQKPSPAGKHSIIHVNTLPVSLPMEANNYVHRLSLPSVKFYSEHNPQMIP